MSRLISINGIRRSGTHAVANWIMSHFTSGCYINDSTIYNRKLIKIESDSLPTHQKECKKTNIRDNPDLLIIGTENEIKNSVLINEIFNDYTKLTNPTKSNRIILIRNYFNLTASHIKAWPKANHHEGLASHWKKYIDFAKSHEYQIIIYDHWLSTEYRDIISQDLGFINKDTGLTEIPKHGGGSSFGDKFPNSNNLKNRWKLMTKNQQYMETVKSFNYWQDYVDLFGKDEAYDFFTSKQKV